MKQKRKLVNPSGTSNALPHSQSFALLSACSPTILPARHKLKKLNELVFAVQRNVKQRKKCAQNARSKEKDRKKWKMKLCNQIIRSDVAMNSSENKK